MFAIQMSHKEQELQDIQREIRKCEAIINSVKVNSVKYKQAQRIELLKLAKQRDRLMNEITEGMFLDK
jgi:hypothetical protein